MKVSPVISLSLLAGLSSAGCGMGGMKQATLLRDCSGGDASCLRLGPLAPLAVGAVFKPTVDAQLAGTTTPTLRLASADTGIVDIANGAMIGRAPGVTAVMIDVDSGVVFDFMHIWVAQPNAVTIERDSGERVADALDLVPGEEVKLHPAVWHDGQRLEGASSLTWTLACDGPCPVALMRDGSPDRRRLRAQQVGKATVVIAGLGLEERLAVEVMP
jgi:hypothetical protein